MAELFTDLLNQLGSLATQLAQHEINLIVGVDEEVQKLQHSFTMVQAMLNNAEERQFTDEKVKPWLDQLRDVYYMMDDVLDCWKTGSQIRKEDEEAKETDCIVSALKKEVCSFFPSPSCCLCQVDNLSLRSKIGHKIENLKQTLDNILKDKEKYGIDLNIQSGVDVDESLKTTAHDIDVSDIIGRNNERDELLELLKISTQEERKPRVISIVGMSGIGKSTLAQLAYHHLPKEANFQIRMWVSVSKPFNKLKVAKAIIESIEQKSPNIIELPNLVERICELIAGKKFFLVLDNVWLEPNSTEWDPIKNALQCSAQDSRILVTTRNNEVAKMMGSAQTHIINLEQLSKNDCLLIFNRFAFVDDKLEQHKHLENLGKQLADKCNGLPLAARTLGSLMRNKRSTDQWNNILDILNSSLWKTPNFPKYVFAPLLLSYYELPLALKHCFSYCAIFSKDHYFIRDELVLLWMAQMNINSKAQMEMEIMVEEYFEYLATRSFFQDFKKDESDDKIIGCKMHYIVHEFAKLITQKECFEINGDNNLEVDINKSARHLQLKISKELKFPKSVYNAEKLRTLFLLSNERDYNFYSLLSKSFRHFRCLRTLILDCPIKKLPESVGNLIQLRCLFMSNDVEIEELPEAICNLSNLQSLSIKNFRSLKKLPLGMGKLINLRHLILSRYVSLSRDSDWDHVVIPKGIENLTSLRTLSDLNLVGEDDREGCKLGELKNLDKLRGILRIRGLRNVDEHEAENAQLKKKIHLRGLELWFGSFGKREVEEDRRRIENDVLVLNVLEPPPELNSLIISDYMGTTLNPNWMMSLTTLKTLHLFVCQKLEHLPPLGKLLSLESLYISGAKSLKKVGVEFLGIESKSQYKKDDISPIFPKLKSLEFRYLEEWEEWIGIGGKREEEGEEEDNGFAAFATKIMPHLDFLRIYECHKLNSLPDFLCAPLKTLRIYGNPSFDQRLKFVSVIMEQIDPLNKVIQSKLETYDFSREDLLPI